MVIKMIAALRKNSKLYLYLSCFYLAMGISRYSQILYFQAQNELLNYSLSYSAMAVFGACAFLITNHLNTWSLTKLARYFLPLYAFGMFLRIFPHSPAIAIISGGISGLGAASVLLILRNWIYKLSTKNESDKHFIVSSRYTIMQTSGFLATILAGSLISLFIHKDLGYLVTLIGSSLLLLSLTFVKVDDDVVTDSKKKSLFIVLPSNKLHGCLFFVAVFGLGMYSSLMEPIIPAILRGSGWSVAQTTIITTVFTLVTIGASFFFQLVKFKQSPRFVFLINQLLMALACLFYLLAMPTKIGLLVVFAASSFTIAGFFITKELIEYEILPKNELVIFLGLAQSGFLVGDSCGSPIGSYIYSHYGPFELVGASLVFCLLSCAIYLGSASFLKAN